MSGPVRIQRKRTKGWKMPPNTGYVGRPTRWGNPFTSTNSGAVSPALRFACEVAPLLDLEPLRGKNLACWCALEWECHADVLLEIVNAPNENPESIAEENSTMDLRLWGWFDDATQREPSYDPPHDAPCPYCLAPISENDVRTHSLMLAGPRYAKRSYFYRTHATCDDANGDGVNMDGKVFDAIAKAGD